MKKIVLLACLLCFSFSSYALEDGCKNNYSALVFYEKNNNILFQKRADYIVYPASLVKVMTLYLTFEAIENKRISSDQDLIVSARGEEVGSVNKVNTMRLKAGDKITVRDAIKAVIVKSFNEAAVTLAEAVAGDEWQFVRMMNVKAAELGMINSSFHNSSGLHEEGQYTTAYDLARLTRAIKKNFPDYYHLFSTKEFTYRGVKYETHNHVLLDYDGAEGLKTGFTNASGFNLISAAKKHNERVISIVLGCETAKARDNFTKNIFNEAFQRLLKDSSIKMEKTIDNDIKKKIYTKSEVKGTEEKVKEKKIGKGKEKNISNKKGNSKVVKAKKKKSSKKN